MGKLAYIPELEKATLVRKFIPRLINIDESIESAYGYYYKNNGSDGLHYQPKDATFLIEDGNPRTAFKKCEEYINSLPVQATIPQTRRMYNAYAPYYDSYDIAWKPILVDAKEDKDDIYTYSYLANTYKIPKKFVFFFDNFEYATGREGCVAIINKYLNKNICNTCDYRDIDINLKCNSCINAGYVDGVGTICRLVKKEKNVTLCVNPNVNLNENVICKDYIPVSAVRWDGFDRYMKAMKDCYYNPSCGYIRSHMLTGNTFEGNFPQAVKVEVKNLYLKGRLIESIWIPVDKWTSRTFIDDEKIYTKFIKYKEIKGSTLNHLGLVYVSEIPYVKDITFIETRLKFIQSITYKDSDKPPFDADENYAEYIDSLIRD